jgi:transposase
MTYKEQAGIKHGFRFLNDFLFQASSALVSRPAQIMELSLPMVLCLLVPRLAGCRLRAHRAQTLPDQVQQPGGHLTMCWIFSAF